MEGTGVLCFRNIPNSVWFPASQPQKIKDIKMGIYDQSQARVLWWLILFVSLTGSQGAQTLSSVSLWRGFWMKLMFSSTSIGWGKQVTFSNVVVLTQLVEVPKRTQRKNSSCLPVFKLGHQLFPASRVQPKQPVFLDPEPSNLLACRTVSAPSILILRFLDLD